MAEASQSDEKLDLKVRDGNGAVTHFKVKKSTKFRKILTAYASKAGIEERAIRLMVDGERVNLEQCPGDLDMENGDQIDALNNLLHITIKWAPSDSTRPLMIPAASTVADLRTALGIGAGPRFVFMGRILDDDAKTLVEYGVESGFTIIAQGRPEHLPGTDPALS